MELRYKVIIADDERIVVDGLINYIQWDQFGIDVVATAENGLDAYHLVQTHQPDILITDIVMPDLDGMELIQKLRSSGFNSLKIILLSGFNEFEFAQKAIANGASGYLLKPTSPQDLNDIIGRMVKELNVEKSLEEMLARSQPYLVSSFYNDVFHGQIQDDGEYRYLLNLFGFREIRNRIAVLMVHPIRKAEEGTSSSSDTGGRLYYSVYIVVKRFIEERGLGYVLPDNQYGVVIILSLAEDWQECDEYRNIGRTLDSLRTSIGHYIDVNATISVGSVQEHSLDGLRKSFKDCQTAMNYRVNFGNHATVYYNDLGSLPHSRPPHPSFQLQVLSRALINRDFQAVQTALKEIFSQENGLIFSDEYINDLCRVVLLTVSLTLLEIGESIRDLWTVEEGDDPWKKNFAEIGNLDKLLQWFERFLSVIIRKIVHLSSARNRRLCDQIKQYVTDNIEHNIKLDQLSGKFNLTPNYISSVFKETTGTSYKDFVANVKIDKARELIKTSRYTNAEIALMLGFRNYEHFRKKFKFLTGLNPSEYY
jgi:two-component system response regulator YesN